jgi:hypothetical protein
MQMSISIAVLDFSSLPIVSPIPFRIERGVLALKKLALREIAERSEAFRLVNLRCALDLAFEQNARHPSTNALWVAWLLEVCALSIPRESISRLK